MDFNFFEWIRQGVKRSVLMGVNDAVECIGTPIEQDKVREILVGYAAVDEMAPNTTVRQLTVSNAKTAPRTVGKLGRRLSDTLKKEAEAL